MNELAQKKCIPCSGGIPPLKGDELNSFLDSLGNDWKVVEGHHLDKEYKFASYREALEFTMQVGELAEEQGHHPDLLLVWGKVRVTVWTHKIDGLTESDFVFAAKTEQIFQQRSAS